MSKMPSLTGRGSYPATKNPGEGIIRPRMFGSSLTFQLFGVEQTTTHDVTFSFIKMPTLKISVASYDIKCFEEL
jgi:hypothetical protein